MKKTLNAIAIINAKNNILLEKYKNINKLDKTNVVNGLFVHPCRVNRYTFVIQEYF